MCWAAGDLIIFPWERDGWTHLYSVSIQGGPAKLLTKDLFFSGHTATTFLLLLYLWPHRRLRWLALAGALAGFLVTIPLYTHFNAQSAAMQFVEFTPWIATADFETRNNRLAEYREYGPAEGGGLKPVPPLEGTDITKPTQNPWGGGGLVSTVGDYFRFGQMLLNGGQLDGVRILSRKTIELMTANHVGTLYNEGAMGFGLGFETQSQLAGSLADWPNDFRPRIQGEYIRSNVLGTGAQAGLVGQGELALQHPHDHVELLLEDLPGHLHQLVAQVAVGDDDALDHVTSPRVRPRRPAPAGGGPVPRGPGGHAAGIAPGAGRGPGR